MRKNWLAIRLSLVCLVFLATPFVKYTKAFVSEDEKKQASQLADTFNERFGRGDADAIYEDTDANFKATVTLERHRLYIAQLQRTVGSPGSCPVDGVWAKYGFFYKKIMLRCYSQFSQGVVKEVFAWRKDGDQYRMTGFRIQ